MLKKILTLFVVTAVVPSVWAVDITAIYGGGNPDGGWTADTDSGITLGLRAKGRNDTSFAGTTPNDGAGTYTFATLEGGCPRDR